MFANYFKIAFRRLVRQKFFSLINIWELAIGLATCLLILSFVIDELSNDRHHENADQIYRSSGQEQEVISYVKEAWKDRTYHMPFEYFWMDKRYDRLYQLEQKLGKIFTIFCMLVLFVASLSLFGFSSFTAEHRTKEIGIRKVPGANAIQIVLLLTQGFIRLVLIAILIALPLAYYGTYQWLEDFAYRMRLNISTFIIPGTLVIVIVWLIISYQSLKVTINKPAASLRNE